MSRKDRHIQNTIVLTYLLRETIKHIQNSPVIINNELSALCKQGSQALKCIERLKENRQKRPPPEPVKPFCYQCKSEDLRVLAYQCYKHDLRGKITVLPAVTSKVKCLSCGRTWGSTARYLKNMCDENTVILDK